MTYCAITCTGQRAFVDSPSYMDAAERVSWATQLAEGSRLVVSKGGRWKGFSVGRYPRQVLASGFVPDPAQWMARAEAPHEEGL